jgi:NAD+-dependent farnesol dehydrogenase
VEYFGNLSGQMHVLVTGGTGYLGQAVVRAFYSAGHNVSIFARAASRWRLPGESIDGDIRDAEAVLRAGANCDVICHLAALVSLWRPRRADFDEVNVGGLRNVLSAAETLRTPRVLVTSSFLALPPSDGTRAITANDYQRTKVAAEQVAAAAAQSGMPIVRLYPGVVYGPGVESEGNLIGRMVRDHLAARLPGIIGADRRWSYAWIDDVAQAYVHAAERAQPGATYVLGGDNAPQMRVFEIVRERKGRRLPRRIPFALATLIGAAEDARAAMLGQPPLLTRGTVEIFRHDWSLDSRAAVTHLELRIRALSDGMERLLSIL